MRSVLTLGVLVVAAASTHGQERRVVDLRVVSVDPAGFRLDVRNVSAKRLDYPVRLTVRLTRLDDTKGPEHAHLIWSFIDPSSGLYREVSPLVKPPRLELEPEQVKTIKVQYGELRWFYEYLGTRTPERLSDLAESGEFDLSVWLEFTPGPWPGADVGPIRVSILVRSSTSPKRS